MIGWALSVFGVRGLVLAGAIAAGLAFLAYEVHHLKELGAEQERQRIERANQEAERKANDGSSDVDKCYAAGNHWNRDRGLCEPGSG